MGILNSLSSVLKPLFGGAFTVASSLLLPQRTTPPETAPLVPMPDPQAQEEARRKSLMKQLARGGRQSTILTAPSGSGEPLGG